MNLTKFYNQLPQLADPILIFFQSLLLRRMKPVFLLLAVCFFTTVNSQAQQVYINEFMASNASTITDEVGDFDDWVELYNAGNSSVNIGGMYLSDDLTNPTAWQIPTNNPSVTTIPAGGYILLWFDKETVQGPLHIDAKLGSSGEDIVLTAANGTTTIDSYTFGVQLGDISEGRTTDGGSNFDFFAEPTPGATNNDSDPGAPMAPMPTVDNIGGFYNNSITVTVSGEGELRYTTDGAKPTTSSPLYTGPLTFDENTPLRVVAFDPPALPSPIMTQTYLFDVNTEFAVVSYVADPFDLFDPATGMYTNFEVEEIEIEANAELWEPNGTKGFNQLFESEIHGTGSAVYAQKPLALKAKKSLGSAVIPYEVFPDQPGYEPRSLILRNAGQDWNITMFRDAFVSSLVRDLSDVGTTITKPKLYTQGHRPGIAYVNGEYWGINNVRERMDKRYIKAQFGLDDDEIDFLENQSEAKEGDFVEWDILTDFIESNSLSSDANLDFVASKIDLDHYIDYVVFNLYIDNQDWPGNNNKRWRERAPGATWNFMTWDLDFSYGLFIPGQPFNSGIATSNSLSRLYEVPNFLWPNPEWATLLFRRLMENDGVRADFVNRMADQLNVLYSPTRVNARIDEFIDTYDSEIQNHHDRWSSGFQTWTAKVQKLKDFANARVAPVRNQFVQQYSSITGTGNITVNLNNEDEGSVQLNTISVTEANAPFTGVYFRGVDVPVRAVPNRGYVLQSWSGSLSGNNPNEVIDFNSNANITANFSLGSTSTQPIVINEINYNSPDGNESGDWIELHNPNNSAVNISGWYFEDESGDYFGLPANTTLAAGGYLVLVENEDEFTSVYPSVSNYIGAFGKDPGGFGLSGGGEQITIKNANGDLIDVVDYDDSNPWPTAADGDGPTLQLIAPSLDNALASSWEASAATPGLPNDSTCDDADNDGICVQNDCDDNDPSIPAAAGTPCNDGNSSTTNDVIQSDGCTCAGTTAPSGDCDDIVVTGGSSSVTIDNVNAGHYIIKLFSPSYSTIINCVDCAVPQVATGLAAGTYYVDVQLYTANWQSICTLTDEVEVGGTAGCPVDADNDGVCAADDCDDNNAAVPATPGTPCNDGNSNTTDDVIQSDQCTCAGIPSNNSTDCDDIVITTTSSSISIGNINTGHYIIKLFSPTWSTIINCVDCAIPQIATGLAEGTYRVDVQLYTAGWQSICNFTEDVEVGGGTGCTDNDNDGVCAPDDCDDNNPNLPATVGSSCNDNNASTENDVIQSDGCTCVGTPVSSGTELGCGVSYVATSNSITVTGLSDAAHASFALFNGSWQTQFNCFDNCDDPLVFDNLSTSNYILRMQIWDAGWSKICDVTEFVDLNNPNNLVGQDGDSYLFFNARKEGRTASLNWTTNRSEEIDHFIVEKSLDGLSFSDLETITPYENREGDLVYQTNDADVAVGYNYYRLTQVMNDGTERASVIHRVKFDLDVDSFELFPNPTRDRIFVNLKAFEGATANMIVYNQLGQPLKNLNVENIPEQPITLDLNGLNGGMYHLVVKIEGRKGMTKRFIIAK
ncbi:MAG: CotH kinase family protein [Saprospiraceae bacterium]